MNRHALAPAFVAGVMLFFLLFVNCANAGQIAQATATPASVNYLGVFHLSRIQGGNIPQA